MWRPDVFGLPVSSPRRRMSFFWRSFVRLSCARKKTMPRSETCLVSYRYGSRCEGVLLPRNQVCFYLLVIARSRIKSSELGASSHSTRFALGNSRPMTGVTSKNSYSLSAPEALYGPVVPAGLSTLLTTIGVSLGASSTAVGAMMESVSKLDRNGNVSQNKGLWSWRGPMGEIALSGLSA